jgi:hypothetical protein
MNIGYIEPLSRGWDRMKRALFDPIDLRKWFIVGFTAFLAGLAEWHGGAHSKWSRRFDGRGWEDVLRFPSEAREWLAANPFWSALILAGIAAAAVLAVVLTWLSSRGNFMFLDNVAHDRARISEPWHEHRPLGNSLFVWRLALGFAGFAVFAGYVLHCLLSLSAAFEKGRPGETLVMSALAMGLGLLALALVMGYVSLFLDDFVSAIMYKRRVTAGSAVGVFWDAFRARPAPFLVYGLIVFCLKIATTFLVVLVGLFTCCAGFLLLAIPYVNSVLLLPVTYTFRAFSLEFLAQFGGDFDCFSDSTKLKAESKAKLKPKAKPAGTVAKSAAKKRKT